ncbi:MAG TPA: thioesterase family protein [Pseudogracilibacillus sp.]|nr:thioesterase family protein [Pseudogracilibacillus sp.]
MRKIAYIEDFESWKEGFSFYTTIPIRFSETDMFGHVNNVSPFIYFEQARIEFLQKIGMLGQSSEEKTMPVVADLQCDYLQQMFFGDELKLYVKANSVGNSSIDIHYLGVNSSDEYCLTGRGRLVNVNVETGKSSPFTEEEREQLLKL